MRLVVALLVMLMVLAGCSSVRTYTFKKDRVDQGVEEGNKGYLEGTPPPAEDRGELKRTMVGADVDVPIFAWEKKKVSMSSQVKGEEVIEVEETIVEVSETKGKPAQIKGEVVEVDEEEEWIK